MNKLIYEKKTSLTRSRCEIFIKYLLSVLQENKNSEVVIHFDNPMFKELKNVIFKELNDNITTYVCSILNQRRIKFTPRFEEDLTSSLSITDKEINSDSSFFSGKNQIFSNLKTNISTDKFIISKKLKPYNEIYKGFKPLSINKDILFFYFLFLNNSSLKMVFFDNHNVNIECGKLLIIPAEWFFSYKITGDNDGLYYISGAIYIDN